MSGDLQKEFYMRGNEKKYLPPEMGYEAPKRAQCLGAVDPTPMRPVQTSLSELQLLIQNAHENFSELNGRILPVRCISTMEKECSEKTQKNPGTCGLDESLQRMVEMVRVLNERIDTALSELRI